MRALFLLFEAAFLQEFNQICQIKYDGIVILWKITGLLKNEKKKIGFIGKNLNIFVENLLKMLYNNNWLPKTYYLVLSITEYILS